MLLVVLVLLATAWPLLRSPKADNWHAFVPATEPNSSTFQRLLATGSDEFGKLIWQAAEDGSIRLLSAYDGQAVANFPSPATEQRLVTCASLSIDRQRLTLGFNDGTYQSTQFVFKSELLVKDQLPEGVVFSDQQSVVVHEQTLIEQFGPTRMAATVAGTGHLE